jgi:hypothetical protein
MFAVGNRLGYTALAIAAAVVVASLGLTVLGTQLWVHARREKATTGTLVVGTMIAAGPLLAFFAIWLTHH